MCHFAEDCWLINGFDRTTIASMPDLKFDLVDGLYAGKIPADEFLRLWLLGHELFHRLQPVLNLGV